MARSQDREQKLALDHDGLLAALHALYGCVSGISPGEVRMTILRVVPASETKGVAPELLEQLTPYVGGTGGEAGRKFSIRSGIAGKAARDKDSYVASRRNDDYETFKAELVSEWSYIPEDAQKLTSDRQSWMAVPIFSKKEGNVMAVVYLDSNVKNRFTQDVLALVVNTCSGIASYISERYK